MRPTACLAEAAGCGRLRVWQEAAGMRPTARLAGGGRKAAECVSGVRLPGCGRLRVWREAAGMRPTACLAPGGGRDAADCVSGGGGRDAADCVSGGRLPGCV